MTAIFSKNLFVIGGVSASVAATVYILWGPSQRRKQHGLCRGLENLGNTCFMNVILQAWAATPSVVSWLSEFITSNDHSAVKHCLAQHILHTLRVLNNVEDDYNEVHSPENIIGALRSRRWVVSHDQQDAHELFNVFTSTLDEESAKFPGTLSLFDVHTLESPKNKYQPQHLAITRAQSPLPVLPGRDLANPFRMLLASQLECVDCKYRHPVRYDLNDSLSLSFPKAAWKSIKLEVLLQRFITSEIVHSVECPGCKKIQTQKSQQFLQEKNPSSIYLDENPKSSCLKRLTIGKLPQCLCLRMQRTQWLDSGIPLKKYEHVIFPESLHLDDYMYNKCEGSGRNGLLGGKALFGNTVVPLPTATRAISPTSGHVTLLRALNYDSRLSSHGLFLQSSPPSHSSSGLSPGAAHGYGGQAGTSTSVQADINHNSPKSQEFSYKLTAVIVHLGDVFSGHFVTYRRSPALKRGEKFSWRWLCTSDHAVKEVSFNEVMAAEAYMLFYERL